MQLCYFYAGYLTPNWAKEATQKQDRQTYYNKIESVENRVDSVTAFRFEGALPRELSQEQNKAFISDWVNTELTSKGAICDIAMHETTAVDGKPNPHVHILVSTRIANETGFEDRKNPAFAVLEKTLQENHAKRKENLIHFRESWAIAQNKHLEDAGFPRVKVNHETLEAQGIDREPEIHMGKHATNAEKQGIETIRGDRNADIKEQNQQRAEAQRANNSLTSRVQGFFKRNEGKSPNTPELSAQRRREWFKNALEYKRYAMQRAQESINLQKIREKLVSIVKSRGMQKDTENPLVGKRIDAPNRERNPETRNQWLSQHAAKPKTHIEHAKNTPTSGRGIEHEPAR